MTFVDFNFYIFIIFLLMIYYMIPKRFQWICLLTGSMLFYLSFTKWYILILLASIGVTYVTARIMQSKTDQRNTYLKEHKADMSREEVKAYKHTVKMLRKKICIVGVVLNIGFLGFFKYTDFVIDTVNQIANLKISLLSLAVPIGISYYIFKSTGYLIDVYRETYEAEGNLARYALFVSFFPSILMGPIGRFAQEKEELFKEHIFEYEAFLLAVQRIMWGFFKKMVIADRLAGYVNSVFGDYQNRGGFQLALTILLFAMQEYADFSGFMDIALGISRLFGIQLAENFQAPFMSATVGEFWRRWHITMGAWFRDYVFYEVVCSKFCKDVSKSKKLSKYWKQAIPVIVANTIIWTLIGFWHGSSWHHVFWGLYNGILIIASFMCQDAFKILNKILHINVNALDFKIFQRIRTFCLFALGELFFTSDTFTESVKIATRMITSVSAGSSISAIMEYIGSHTLDAATAVISVLLLIVADILQYNQIAVGEVVVKQHLVTRWVLYLTCIFSIILLGVYGLDNSAAFIYMGI